MDTLTVHLPVLLLSRSVQVLFGGSVIWVVSIEPVADSASLSVCWNWSRLFLTTEAWLCMGVDSFNVRVDFTFCNLFSICRRIGSCNVKQTWQHIETFEITINNTIAIYHVSSKMVLYMMATYPTTRCWHELQKTIYLWHAKGGASDYCHDMTTFEMEGMKLTHGLVPFASCSMG